MHRTANLLIILSIIITALPSPSLALAPLASPRAVIGEGRWSIGGDLVVSETDMEVTGTHQETISGVTYSTNHGYDLKKLKSNQLFAQFGYGILENWDVYARLGLSSAKGDLQGRPNPAPGSTNYATGNEYYQVDSGGNFAWGLGTRVTFMEQSDISWGATLQIHRYDPKQTQSRWYNSATEYVTADVDLKYWEAQLSVGPTFNFDSFWLYLGPFLHFINGDLDMGGTWYDGGTTGPINGSYDVQENSIIGGFLGAQWVMAENSYLYIEGQATGDAWGMGLGGVYRIE